MTFMSTADFYDAAEPFYHLIYPDWQAAIERQGAALTEILRGRFGSGVQFLLDATCGIGTQALGLGGLGFQVAASDISPRSITRLKAEAAARGLAIEAKAGDIRQLWGIHQRQFDAVISCDNALPHLNPEGEMPLALAEMFRCTRPGGGCLITLRDYAAENLQGLQLRPYGVRQAAGKRFAVFQVWDCHPLSYDVTLYFLEDDGKTRPRCHAARSTYFPIRTNALTALMEAVGFVNVERLDGVFFQPVLLGERPG
jgi:SAM-dependent methyltransferase